MLGTGDTLIQKTFKRLNKFVPTENILILTNERYNDLVLEQLPLVKQEQVVLEPAMRNTAPCILYAAMKIQKMKQLAERNEKISSTLFPSRLYHSSLSLFTTHVPTLSHTATAWSWTGRWTAR